tara:strand:- start:110 stop:352 length:243 start_codon:yes stop_codon:yes gene_type:complete
MEKIMRINKNKKYKPDLTDYINLLGEKVISKQYNISVHTVFAWKYGNRQPSVKQAKQIIKQTEGRIDYESIYGSISDILN